MPHLIIVGTSHVAQQSKKAVKKAIEENNPDIIAVELDQGRLHALLNPKDQNMRLRDIRHVGVKGWVFALIGKWVENTLGKHVGVKPGEDMLTAVRLARKNKVKLALIDQDIRVTLKRFSKFLTWKEKWNFAVDLVKGVLFRKNAIPFDLRQVPDSKTINKLINQVKKRYPNVHRVLVKERNEFMAKNLAYLLNQNQESTIVAVVGAGHGEEMERLVKKYTSPKKTSKTI
jgi:pheromone shutdown-related protein TraB